MAPRAKPKLSLVDPAEPDQLASAGSAWLAHLRAEGRSVKTLYDRERSLYGILFPALRDAGVRIPDQSDHPFRSKAISDSGVSDHLF